MRYVYELEFSLAPAHLSRVLRVCCVCVCVNFYLQNVLFFFFFKLLFLPAASYSPVSAQFCKSLTTGSKRDEQMRAGGQSTPNNPHHHHHPPECVSIEILTECGEKEEEIAKPIRI